MTSVFGVKHSVDESFRFAADVNELHILQLKKLCALCRTNHGLAQKSSKTQTGSRKARTDNLTS